MKRRRENGCRGKKNVDSVRAYDGLLWYFVWSSLKEPKGGRANHRAVKSYSG